MEKSITFTRKEKNNKESINKNANNEHRKNYMIPKKKQ